MCAHSKLAMHKSHSHPRTKSSTSGQTCSSLSTPSLNNVTSLKLLKYFSRKSLYMYRRYKWEVMRTLRAMKSNYGFMFFANTNVLAMIRMIRTYEHACGHHQRDEVHNKERTTRKWKNKCMGSGKPCQKNRHDLCFLALTTKLATPQILKSNGPCSQTVKSIARRELFSLATWMTARMITSALNISRFFAVKCIFRAFHNQYSFRSQMIKPENDILAECTYQIPYESNLSHGKIRACTIHDTIVTGFGNKFPSYGDICICVYDCI